MKRALTVAPLLLALGACATEPAERKVRAEFACQDGRKLRVVYWLDRGAAELRLSRKEVANVTREPGVPGRAYAGEGWSLRGLGDEATLVTPGAAPVRCTETR